MKCDKDENVRTMGGQCDDVIAYCMGTSAGQLLPGILTEHPDPRTS